MMSTGFPIELKQLPGRGRGLVTTRDVQAGEVLIAEEPLLLTVSQEFKDHACANCLCWLQRCPGAVQCQECHQAAFCSAACQQQAAARPWLHAAATCRAYAFIPELFPGDIEQQNYLRFLIQAAAIKAAAAAGGVDAALAHTAGAAYQVMLSLVGEATPATTAAAALLHPALCQAVGDSTGQLLSAAEVATLLAKEQLNCFGLLAPLHLQQQHPAPVAAAAAGADADEDSEGRSSRRLRGGALYPICALLNHECIPNVARFDALDAAVGGAWPAQWPHKQQQQQQTAAAAVAAVAGSDAAAAAALAAAAGLSASPHGSSGGCGCGSNGGCGGSSSTTLVTMRALHGLPAGTEVVLSYVPLNWDLQDRQQQTQQVYGFTCSCPRCLLEGSPEWQEAQQDGDSSGGWETDSGSGDVDLDMASPLPAAGGMQEDGSTHHHGHDHNHQQQGQPQQQEQEPMEAGYLSVFLLKYMCPKDGCYGTMAAVHGSAEGLCECSVCGALRSEAEFLAELEGQQ